MKNEEIMHELESLVCAMEESLTIITGTISETGDPVTTLHSLLAAEEAVTKQFGHNAWRDRLMCSARKIAAQKARHDSADPALQTLIASVLGDRGDGDKTH